MTDDDKDHWSCDSCINLFPFNHTVDDKVFVILASNNDSKYSHINCDDLLFNPFQLCPIDDKTLHGDDYDPDIHYYNDPQRSKYYTSNYYDISEFNAATTDSKTLNN